MRGINRGAKKSGDGDPEGGASVLSKGRRGGLIWILLAVLLFAWVWGPLGEGIDGETQISYSEFREQVEAGNVQRITSTGDEILGELNASAETQIDGETQSYQRFVTYVPSFGDETLLAQLEERGVEVRTEPESEISWWAIMLNALPFLILIWLAWFFFTRMRSQGQGIFSMGKSQAKAYDREQEGTTFGDVAGAQNAKAELEEIIEFLKDPDRFQKLGGEIPRGVLLVGPPGTGKTLLARAVAGEAEAPFYNMTGSDFMEMLVGVGASRVRDLFKEAKKESPAIIFIDELDSIGRQRGAGLGGGHDEREQTLNQLLSEMDGFEPTHEVVVMAATNRPDILDPALLRPGRFDRRITVDLPTKESRRQILALHAAEKPMSEDVDLEELARGTPGFSGADLANLLNEAALLAAREDKDAITRDDVGRARDKVLLGLERQNLAMDEQERRLLAYHEGGHAVLASVLPHADPLHKVTIVPRGRSMGVTQQLPEKEKYIYRREYLLDRLGVMMGGRAAEDIVMDTATSGAEQDLKQATQLARKMVLDWGMSERFKDVALGGQSGQVFLGDQIAQQRDYSETTARDVDQEVQAILSASYRRATETLREHRAGLDRLAELLLREEEVEAERVFEVLGVSSDGAKPSLSGAGGQAGPDDGEEPAPAPGANQPEEADALRDGAAPEETGERSTGEGPDSNGAEGRREEERSPPPAKERDETGERGARP